MALDRVINRSDRPGRPSRGDLLRLMDAYCGSAELAAKAMEVLDRVQQAQSVSLLQPLTVASAVGQYMQTVPWESADTQARYGRVLEAFALWGSVTHPVVTDLTFPIFNHYISRPSIGGNTRNLEVSALKGFGEWLKTLGYLPNNPAEKLKRVKVERRGPIALPPKEQRDLLLMTKKSKRLGARNYAMTCVFLFAGLRASEACSLTWGDIDFDRKMVRFLGKRKKRRCVPLLPVLERALCDLKEKQPAADKSSFLFVKSQGTNQGAPMDRKAVAELFCDWFRALGIPSGVSVHCLRHSFAVNMIWMKVSVNTVQHLLGHSSLTTTSIYTELYDKDVFEEVNRLCSGVDDALEQPTDESAWARAFREIIEILEKDEEEDEPEDDNESSADGL